MNNELGNKEIMAANIKYYMELYRKDRTDLCRDLGFRYTTLTDWIKGNTYPRIDNIEMMARYFKINKSDLVERHDRSSGSEKIKGIRIPVVGRVAAGIPITAVEEAIDWEEIPESMAKSGEFFGLKIKGDSMQPRICENDIVIVRKQDDAESDDIVIAIINGNEGTCKRLLKYEAGISLISFNPSYAPMNFSQKEIEDLPVRIIGKVVENRQKY